MVAALACWSVLEMVLRQDLAPRPLLLLAVLAVLGPLLWRRTHPLVAVAVSFGTWTIVDIVRIPFAMASAVLPDRQARLRRAEDELTALKAAPPPTRPSLGSSSGA